MQQAFAAAESGEEGPHIPSLDFALKPGETLSLNLAAKVVSLEVTYSLHLLKTALIALGLGDGDSHDQLRTYNCEK